MEFRNYKKIKFLTQNVLATLLTGNTSLLMQNKISYHQQVISEFLDFLEVYVAQAQWQIYIKPVQFSDFQNQQL